MVEEEEEELHPLKGEVGLRELGVVRAVAGVLVEVGVPGHPLQGVEGQLEAQSLHCVFPIVPAPAVPAVAAPVFAVPAFAAPVFAAPAFAAVPTAASSAAPALPLLGRYSPLEGHRLPRSPCHRVPRGRAASH